MPLLRTVGPADRGEDARLGEGLHITSGLLGVQPFALLVTGAAHAYGQGHFVEGGDLPFADTQGVGVPVEQPWNRKGPRTRGWSASLP